MSLSRAFVLLCAEEDDLALVQWVHAARERGLAPEIVTGVEHDDAPLLDALADVDCGLFVVLRSDHLDAVRMRGIKAAFGRHRRPAQRLFALRLDIGAAAAIERIAAELAGGSRPRSETSMVIAIDDLLGPGAGEVVGLRAAPPTVPSVDRALRPGARTVEHEVTAQLEIGDETIPMLPSSIPPAVARPRRAARSPRTPLLAALGLAGAAAGVATIVAVLASSDVTAATMDATGPAAIAPATLATAAIATVEPAPPEPAPARVPAVEAPVVIRLQPEAVPESEPEPEPEPEPEVILIASDEAPRGTAPRHRVARRATATAPQPATTPPPPVEVVVAEPAPVDALPIEPAPLEAPPVAPAIAATPAPTPSPSAAEPTPAVPPAP